MIVKNEKIKLHENQQERLRYVRQDVVIVYCTCPKPEEMGRLLFGHDAGMLDGQCLRSGGKFLRPLLKMQIKFGTTEGYDAVTSPL